MNEQHRPFLTSQFISSGPWAHKDSPFAQFNLGFSSIEPTENVHSSTWLWQSLGKTEIRPRFAMGYPDEWKSFQQAARSSDLLSQSSLDLWVFRDLSTEERQGLQEILLSRSDFRLVLAVTHLWDGEKFIQDESFQEFFQSRRAFFSFLPPSRETDPFFSPQEVLWKLQSLPSHIPILIQDFPRSQPSFFRSLKNEDWAQEIQSKNSFLVFVLKSFDRLGLGNFVLFLESFLSFFLGQQVSRLSRAMGYLFELNPWRHKLQNLWVFVWHRTTVCIFSFVWYQMLWRSLNFIWFQVFYRSLLFLWFRLLWRPADFIWNVGIKKTSIWLWHRRLWPAISFVWYRGIFSFYSFSRHKLIPRSWIFLRYRLLSFLLLALYPLRKIYWILSHEYDKRIRYRKRVL